ncbi:MAG: Asp-tRNA(Asn)/Glu-tRNA(Gln) amidotransferase GatCAB subunit B, partial [Pseudomonadota bacterium]|nr:Asp-tRNA(Asn)/Glu-tRNA(Gln) amidotransferase GatCAB subunit B [Pseudomonadota bacterium]
VAAAKIGKPEAKVATQVANWALSVAPGVVKSLGEEADMANATAEAQAAILAMQDKGEISGGQAKEIYEIVLKTGRDPEEIADSEGLKQVSDTGAIETAIDEILANNEDKVEQYRGGKDKLFGFFVGQTMKAMQGKANPAVVNQILKDKLG